ncbi:MAG: tripartite tricarboxylate transporter substrate binding protein, partial [Betaproteobacteria bacterium]
MNKIKYLLIVTGCCAAIQPALAQQAWPQRTVRVIGPFAAGGNTDFTARSMATKFTEMWGQQVIVDNRPGGATYNCSDIAANGTHDSYTRCMGAGSYPINMTLFAKPPSDTLR